MALNMDRREFLTAAGASALASVIPTKASAIPGPLADPGHLRVAVLDEPGFPTVDAPAPDFAVLGAALEGLDVAYLAAGELADRLSPDRFDVFVMPYGSAFPKEAWPAIHGYLQGAGNWVVLGGTPCAVPVERTSARGWQALPREITYHKQLGINLACAMSAASVSEWRANEALPWAAALAQGVAAGTVWEPYWRLSSVPDAPEESGSSGTHEADVVPLVSGLDAAGRPLVAPLVLVDRLEREYAGGRWVLATGDGALPPATLRALVEAAARGARQLRVRPSFACYRDGERPSVSVAFHGFPRAAAAPLAATCRIRVFGARDTALATVDVAVDGTDAEASGSAELGPALPDPLAPGLYRLEAALTAPGEHPLELRSTTGFWVWDEQLLGSGTPLVPGPFGFARQGRPYPVTGTTYMASDVHRKFLLQPNPWLWDRDFAAMRGAGVNLVRTGLWTGWKDLMPVVGQLDEGALRALDAWMLTARRHDMPVIFNLFAFLPETWGGENPYLDPAAVAAQSQFVSLVARRYVRMRELMWDLINEPSFCNKDHLWSCRPNYDRFERAAWAAWLAERGLAAADLPALADFGEGAEAVGHPTMVVEYRLFAQATFRRWVGEMRAALREAGAGRQLVTVGQDEAGTRDSPNNLFLAPELDFTCVHTWWLNDALVWDEVLTKASGRTNLVEETGVMFAAHPPGVEARWEEYARNLLERKMAIALGPGGGAGFVEWVWNSNCYMASDNEAAIGLLRADGTAKPELETLTGVAAFAAEARRHLVGREEEPVLLVVPHATMFSTANTATAATKRAVRAMQYGCRMGLLAVSEFEAAAAMRVPRLVLVPSPGVLHASAWDAVRAWARRGAVVLVTGPLEQLAGLRAGLVVGPSGAVRLPSGRGEILWAPEAVETARDEAAAVALYRWALGRARLAPAFTVRGADASILVHAATYRSAVLYTLASEGSSAASVGLKPHGAARDIEVELPAERAALVLVDRASGRLIARYQPA